MPAENAFEYFKVIGAIVGLFFALVIVIAWPRSRPKAQRKPKS